MEAHSRSVGVTETPARSTAPRTSAYGDACPLDGAANKRLRRCPPARWRREQGLVGPVEGPPLANPPSFRAPCCSLMIPKTGSTSCFLSLYASQRKAGKGVFFLHLARKLPARLEVKSGASSVPQAGCSGRSPRRGTSSIVIGRIHHPRNAERRLHLSPKGGCREFDVPPGGAGGLPLYSKTLEGGAGGIEPPRCCGQDAQAKTDPPFQEGAGQN